MKACAIVLAAGSGKRMNSQRNKVFLKFDDQSALIRTLKTFANLNAFERIIVACRPEDRDTVERKVERHMPRSNCVFCDGGSERQYSVRNALKLVPADAEVVCVHDAARCFVTPDVIERTLESARQFGSGVAAIPMTDTVKEVSSGRVERTLDRDALVRVQTPQSFSVPLLREAYAQAERDGFLGTDDASLLERIGEPVRICEGDPQNIKLTYPQDVEEGQRILDGGDFERLRVGCGFDVHRFSEDRPLVLGGVKIPDAAGLEGHSDADVLAHAIMDALLGAAGFPDIGYFFPPDDPAYLGISSMTLLSEVGAKVRAEGYSIVNIDCTLVLEKPKIQPYSHSMSLRISDALGVLPEKVNVKATTAEKLGSLGRGEGAGAQAVCLLTRSRHDAAI